MGVIQWFQGAAILYNCTHTNTRKKIPVNDYCNRTTEKGADQALKFRIHQYFYS